MIAGPVVPSCKIFVQGLLKQFPLAADYVCLGRKPEVSVMRSQVDLDRRHCRAIILEIGERLGASLRVEPEIPASYKTQIERLRELDDQESPSIVPYRGEVL